MIRILDEYLIRTEEQKDIVLDRLYNDPKLRKYQDLIEYIVEATEEVAHDIGYDPNYDIDEWFSIFFSTLEKENIIAGKRNPRFEDICDFLYINPEDEDAEEKVQTKFNKITRYMYEILDDDKTLQTDLFYTSSGTKADIKNNDWREIEELAETIAEYTDNYEVAFTNSEAFAIKRHMKETNKTLYRIEPFTQNCVYSQAKKSGENKIIWKDARTKGIKSFTEEPNAEAMKGMKLSRSQGNDAIVIYETVGIVKSFNIDQLSRYAWDLSSLEYEHFVSGVFDIVEEKTIKGNEDKYDEDIDAYCDEDLNYAGDIIWVKIKQIHK